MKPLVSFVALPLYIDGICSGGAGHGGGAGGAGGGECVCLSICMLVFSIFNEGNVLLLPDVPSRGYTFRQTQYPNYKTHRDVMHDSKVGVREEKPELSRGPPESLRRNRDPICATFACPSTSAPEIILAYVRVPILSQVCSINQNLDQK